MMTVDLFVVIMAVYDYPNVVQLANTEFVFTVWLNELAVFCKGRKIQPRHLKISGIGLSHMKAKCFAYVSIVITQ